MFLSAQSLCPGDFIEVGVVVARVEEVGILDGHDHWDRVVLTTRHRDGIREWHRFDPHARIRVCPDFAWTNDY